MCDVRTTLAWGGAVCSAWSSLEDNPRNRFSRALLSSPPAVRMSCCTQIGEHQPDQPPRCRGLGWKLATLSGAVSAVGTMVLWWVARRRHSISSIVSVVSTRGGDTVQCHHCHVRPSCCSSAFYLGPKGSKDSPMFMS